MGDERRMSSMTLRSDELGAVYRILDGPCQGAVTACAGAKEHEIPARGILARPSESGGSLGALLFERDTDPASWRCGGHSFCRWSVAMREDWAQQLFGNPSLVVTLVEHTSRVHRDESDT